MAFSNPITGGQGSLVRPAIKSPDYTPGVQGWSINKDGTAEFNDITIRGGTVVSGEALYYNGPPGPGNLILSISAAGGTDQYGNVYPKGITTFGSHNGRDYTIRLNEATIDFNEKGSTHIPAFIEFYNHLGIIHELFISSGRPTTSYQQAGFSLISESSPGLSDSYISMQADTIMSLGKLTAPNFASGKALIPAWSGSQAWTQVYVPFPQIMSGVPNVNITPVSGTSAISTSIPVAINDVTTQGFYARMNRSTATATTVHWFAHVP